MVSSCPDPERVKTMQSLCGILRKCEETLTGLHIWPKTRFWGYFIHANDLSPNNFPVLFPVKSSHLCQRRMHMHWGWNPRTFPCLRSAVRCIFAHFHITAGFVCALCIISTLWTLFAAGLDVHTITVQEDGNKSRVSKRHFGATIRGPFYGFFCVCDYDACMSHQHGTFIASLH